ncbi:hypothetical protein [Micromonospora sp. NBC_00858]|uniref:hypothetical protein n=1 Tax=Micromonospora sp. NBC_00858 TaxID=2975979 RepID=UPI0038634B03|nr:hypothetical protein OG990_06230 [Micromonospora sp. NBC_00858]
MKGTTVRVPKAMTAITLALAATLLTTGCMPGSKPEREQAAAGGGAPGKPDERAPVIATVEAQVSHAGHVVPLKVELFGPRRDQGFVTVNVRVTNLTPEGQGSSLGWQINDAFAGSTRSVGGKQSFSGVYLLDRKNHKQYLVARNANEEFLASANLNAVFVKPQQAAELFATFGAPPADVTALDLAIPQIPVFENVPLG